MRDLVSNKIHQLQVQRYKLDYIFSQLFFFCYLKMFHKIAKHYVKKRDYQRAIQSLEEAEKLQHIRHPDFNVLSTKAKTLLDIGSYQESLKLATTILHNKGIIILQLFSLKTINPSFFIFPGLCTSDFHQGPSLVQFM